MTNPTTQEGEDFETIVGLANRTKVDGDQEQLVPDEHPNIAPLKGAYPVDLPRPSANGKTDAHQKTDAHEKTEAHGKSPKHVGGAYPVDVPNPSAQAKDDQRRTD